MKLFALLFILPVAASAQNNAQCPFKLPFQFTIGVGGIFQYNNTEHGMVLDSFTAPGSFEEGIYADSENTQIKDSVIKIISSRSETQLNSFDSGLTVSVVDSCIIIFDSINHNITKLSFFHSEDSFIQDYQSRFDVDLVSSAISFSNFGYDSLGFSCDSDFSVHTPSVQEGEWWYPDGIGQSGYYNLIAVTNINLGIYLANPHSRVTVIQQQASSFSLNLLNTILQCTFESSAHSRILELYTPLGVKVASFEIAPSQSEISLPHLSRGLYFIRMDNAFLKIAVQ